ncbi:MAG TPA: glycosyltransferase [Candidatus Polarisedimenticolaceae bacterium]|nr:glycosyltransferase [Candidatus Polarisedimenticolaceae bacterium]
MRPSLTAAICTRDRPHLLQRALASLAAQRESPAEILVVDNAPADSHVRALVAQSFPSVRYLAEPAPGLDFSRNRALRAARGEVVAFLDDDAVADPGWSAALRAAFEEPRVGAVTGRVEALALETEAQRLFEANGGFGRGGKRVRLPADAGRPLHGRRAPLIAWAVSVGSGCSLAVRRELALRLGGFDEALDLGEALPGGGDHDVLWRVLEAGYHVVYEPTALARHEHRRDAAGMGAQLSGHQRALVALMVKILTRSRGRRRAPVAAFLAWRLVKPGHRLARRLLGKDPLPAPLLLRMWRDCMRGLWAYPLARREAARRRRLA